MTRPEPITNCVGQTTFAEFTAQNGIIPTFPVQFNALSQFIVTTAEESSVSTVKSYLNHLWSYHIDYNYSTAAFVDEQIQWMLKGALRKYGTKPTRVRLEVTKEILHAMLSTFGPVHDDINLCAAFCTEFAAFLHIGKFHLDSMEP